MRYVVCLIMIFSAFIARNMKAAIPQENVMLSVVNGDTFVSGDTLRFNAELAGDLGSQYLYVELIDPFGKVCNRVKIKRSDDRFAGYVAIDREIPEGTYTLAAYTMFMQNRGADYFYRAPIEIRSIYAYKYAIKTEYANNLLSVNLTDTDPGEPVGCETPPTLFPWRSAARYRVRYGSDGEVSLCRMLP